MVGCWLVLSLPPLSPTEKYRVTDSPLLKPLPFHIYCCPFPAPALLPHLIPGHFPIYLTKGAIGHFLYLNFQVLPLPYELMHSQQSYQVLSIPSTQVISILYLLLRCFLYFTFYSGAFLSLSADAFPSFLSGASYYTFYTECFPSLLADAFPTFLSGAY